MTFLDTIKNEIIEAPLKKPCCRKNMLLGMLAARGRLTGTGEVELSLAHKGTAELAVHLIREQFGRQAELTCGSHGGRARILRFESPAAVRFLETLPDALLAGHLQKPCPSCAAAHLKGLFLASGHISDPQKTYHLEFSLGVHAASFLPFFEDVLGFSPKLVTRKDETLLYFKNSSSIEDVMTVLGINDAAFLLMNCKIEKQFRNEANRRTNCEAGNITRAVNAAAKILAVLRKMEREDRLSSLPEELYDVAQLRLANPEASLTQLAALTTPPLTKSGVNHRLQKILELAEKNGYTS